MTDNYLSQAPPARHVAYMLAALLAILVFSVAISLHAVGNNPLAKLTGDSVFNLAGTVEGIAYDDTSLRLSITDAIPHVGLAPIGHTVILDLQDDDRHKSLSVGDSIIVYCVERHYLVGRNTDKAAMVLEDCRLASPVVTYNQGR